MDAKEYHERLKGNRLSQFYAGQQVICRYLGRERLGVLVERAPGWSSGMVWRISFPEGEDEFGEWWLNPLDE